MITTINNGEGQGGSVEARTIRQAGTASLQSIGMLSREEYECYQAEATIPEEDFPMGNGDGVILSAGPQSSSP
eukprot:6478775-Amphidinium_carterae.1